LPPGARENLAAWLAAGAQGDMDWMAATFERRADPKVLWPQARSVVMLAMNYGPAVDPLAALRDRNSGAISVYARHGSSRRRGRRRPRSRCSSTPPR
jgi:epoxyqueuosine reductase